MRPRLSGFVRLLKSSSPVSCSVIFFIVVGVAARTNM